MSGLDRPGSQAVRHGFPFGPCSVLYHLTGHQRSVETVSFSPDSKQLASGGWDKQVMLWEVQVCGGTAREEAWNLDETPPPHWPRKGHSIFPTVNAHTWHPRLPFIWQQLWPQAFTHTPALMPMRFPLPGLPSPDKAWEASQTVFLFPRQPCQEGLGLTHLLAWEASGLPSEAQGSLL